LGIIAANPNGEMTIKANKGLILTCGGFHQNKEMQINYLSMPYMAQGCLGGTGDGITMTQEIGAKMWHMTGVSCGISYMVPDYDIPIAIGIHSPHYIYVDQTGKRFLNETGADVHAMAFDFTACVAEEMAYPRLPAYLIFDENCRESGPMIGHCPGLIMDDPTFSWSEDNKTEIEKGWIKMGWTINELGKALGFHSGVLEAAVGEYNQSALTGYDPIFKRNAASMAPLNKAPFYAIEVWPALLNTQGGPQRDEEARILNFDMKPIPRLYSAGELGSIVNKFYPGGTNITEAIAFGRVAGQNAAQEEPVE
jgi:succinate dehydrogenase/fumarate reductase flavoprotein subunit